MVLTPAAGRPASDTPAPAAPADGPSPRSMREVLKRLGISNIAAAEALRDAAFNGQVPAETFGAITARQVLDLDGTALQLAVEFLHAKGVA